MTTSRTPSGESLRTDTYFRVLPKHVHFTNKDKDSYAPSYILYLEKGLQIYGKSTPIMTQMHHPKMSFPPNNNKFDFQVASEKLMEYKWALYELEDGFEERVEEKTFSLKPQYDRFSANQKEGKFLLETTFKNIQIKIQFVLLIHNTLDNIVLLTNRLLQDYPVQLTSHIQEIAAATPFEYVTPPDVPGGIFEQAKQDELNQQTEQKPEPVSESNHQIRIFEQAKSRNEEKQPKVAEYPTETFKFPERPQEEQHPVPSVSLTSDQIPLNTESAMREQEPEMVTSSMKHEQNINDRRISQEGQLPMEELPMEQQQEEELILIKQEETPVMADEGNSSPKLYEKVSKDETVDEFQMMMKEQQKRQKLKKLAIIIVILVLVFGLLGSALMPSSSKPAKKTKSRRKK